MKTLQFTIDINATREKVWGTLWSDKTFRNWAGIIDEGTYLSGELTEGAVVQFISSVSEYGVSSLIAKLIPFEHIEFRHLADTKDSGTAARADEWTGGTEIYHLDENDGITTLTLTSDIPLELEEIFLDRTPKALERVKALAEQQSN